MLNALKNKILGDLTLQIVVDGNSTEHVGQNKCFASTTNLKKVSDSFY